MVSIVLIVILVIVVLLVLYGISIYNKMVRNKNLVKEAWSTVDVFLKKRYDLIPNLVETVKGYASHEKETLTEVIRMRNTAMGSADNGNIQERMKNENYLTTALDRLLVTFERYPELKANTNFLALQSQLTDLESDIEKSRRYYNGTVRENNILIESFPSSIVAGIGNFKTQPFFEIDEKSKEVPTVSF